jgi:hypothetical protein
LRTTSTDYTKPYRPLPVSALNAVGKFLSSAGYKGSDLSVKSLIRGAQKKTGLSDFGDDKIPYRLGILTDSIEKESRLNFFGRFMVRQTLLGTLTNRLRMEEDFKNHPEINDIEIKKPVFIAGLQRTGTTMLQRLLASDDDIFRHLPSWEALNPALRSDLEVKNGREPRIALTETAAKALSYIAPDFYAVHPVDAEGPEEDCILMNFALLSVVPEATQRVPSFSAWLDEQDQFEAYRFHKRMLKYLLWQKNGQRWILKTPDHMLHLDALFAVYPDAKIIQTHRDPLKTTSSFCSMMAHAYGVFSDQIDVVEIGKHWSEKALKMVNKTNDVRKQKPDAFIDVYYKKLMEDPISEIKRIYKFVDTPLTEKAESRMSVWINKNPQNRYGKHSYSIDSFGMSTDDIDRMFGEYIDKYKIPLERKTKVTEIKEMAMR